MRGPIAWFGGKQALAKKLLPLIPAHNTYVEVFGGGAALLFAKKPSPLEVYNDLDSGLVTFFRVLRDPQKFARFYFLACLTPYSREEWEYCRDTWADVEDDVDRAYRWFVVARNSFGGMFGRSWGFDSGAVRESDARPMVVSRWRSTLALLPAIHERLALVEVEHRDFRDILRLYDSARAFFYLDPPYVPETRRDGWYEHELTLEDHAELVSLLLKLKGKAMLSGYDHEVYRPLEEAGWQKRQFSTVCRAAARTRATGLAGEGNVLAKQQRTEVVWMNYDPIVEMPLLKTAGGDAYEGDTGPDTARCAG